MRFAVLMVVSLLVASVNGSPSKVSVLECQKEFSVWMTKHGISYDRSELFTRFTTFCNELDNVREHNSKKLSWTKALNKFSAHSKSEWSDLMGFKFDSHKVRDEVHTQQLLDGDVPDSVDWTQQGAVTGVKDQGQCGSCWAFSTTGGVEGAWQISQKKLVSLSEQQIMDCSISQGNQGCNGGLMDYAFKWIVLNGGVTDELHPYMSGSGTDPTYGNCTVFPSVAKISTFKDVTPNNQDALKAAVALGPVSIAIEADQGCFQGYSSGVLSNSACACGTNLDHGVLLVGYGFDTASNMSFWKVKNSWGSGWGDNGYIRLQRGNSGNTTLPSGGMCGILMAASYPVV